MNKENGMETAQSKRLKKKKRKRRIRILITLLILLLIAAGVGGYFLWKQYSEAEEEIVIEAGEGEEIVYASITSIVGNNIEVAYVVENEEADTDTETDFSQMTDMTSGDFSLPDGADASSLPTGEMSEGDFDPTAMETENAADGDSESESSGESATDTQTMPENGEMDGSMPEGADLPSDTSDGEEGTGEESQEGSDVDAESASSDTDTVDEEDEEESGSSSTSSAGGMDMMGGMGGFSDFSALLTQIQTAAASAYTETGETASYQIPVGTTVITTLNVETTFSRLSAGDVIAILLEEGTDNILKIWIVE